MFAILYSETNIVCILILLMICFKLRTVSYTQYNQRLLTWVILSNCFFIVLDIFWILLNSGSLSLSSDYNWLLNALYYITAVWVGFIWFFYSEKEQRSRLVEEKSLLLLCAAPFLLMTLLALISLKTGWLFYIDETNAYHRGPIYSLQVLCSYGYVLFTASKALARSLRTNDYRLKVRYRLLAGYVIPSLVAGVIQLLLPRIPILSVGTTCGLLYIFLTTQEQMIFIDVLTGLNNRNRLIGYLSERIAHFDGSRRLYLLMIDVDKFKQINDKYGHVEGDEALRRIAEALKASVQQSHQLIARYGGDEFAAVCELDDSQDICEFCAAIHRQLTLANSGQPYQLSVSVGYACYHPGLKVYQELIKLADADLYRVKQAR